MNQIDQTDRTPATIHEPQATDHDPLATAPQPPGEEKAAAVEAMFGRLAQGYDLANTLISFGQHRLWKRRAVRLAAIPPGGRALDLCTGTGDLAILLANGIGPTGSVVGLDFCGPMLEIASRRTDRARTTLSAPVDLVRARAEQLPLQGSSFDACTVAFGLRNVADLHAALCELMRVLKPGGRLVSLDVSTPASPLYGRAYAFYFEKLLPMIGSVVNRSLNDYAYLPRSAKTFPQRQEMCRHMIDAGFVNARFHSLSGGAVAIHVAEKAS